MAKTRTRKQNRNEQITLNTVRQIALALPGVKEANSYRSTSFSVGGKTMARFHQDGETLVLKAEYAAREVLMGAHPETFYVTDQTRCYPWVFVRLANVDLGLLRGLIEDAWRNVAPKRVLAAYKERGKLHR